MSDKAAVIAAAETYHRARDAFDGALVAHQRAERAVMKAWENVERAAGYKDDAHAALLRAAAPKLPAP